MSLTLITGPAGSGKTGAVLNRFVDWLDSAPVLVVPTGADVTHYEHELLHRSEVVLGGQVATFERLFELVGRAVGTLRGAPLGSEQRRAVCAAVLAETPLSELAAAAEGSGFPDELERFFSELGAAGIDAGRLDERLGGRNRFERELTMLYGAYRTRIGALGGCDEHSRAATVLEALAADPSGWSGRPVLIHGFDDLSGQQLRLVELLTPATELVVSVVHEPGRLCLRAREGLAGRLADSADRSIELEPVGGGGALEAIERGFLVDGADGVPAGGQVVLLESAGRRNELELVAAEVCSLLRQGVAPESIALIARTPEQVADLATEVFAASSVPLVVHAPVDLSRTGPGGALIALARAAFGDGAAADLFAYLGLPGRARRATVDRAERELRQAAGETIEEAVEAFSDRRGREVWELADLARAAELGGSRPARELARIARDIFRYPRRCQAPVLSEAGLGDLLAGEEAADALERIADLIDRDPSLAPSTASLVDLLSRMQVPRARGTDEARVQLMSPYRARAQQFEHVFVLSLQEGEFPRRRSADPFLDDAQRARAELPVRSLPAEEERYLFYVCLSRARARLHLSYRVADDDGAELTRSFFVDDVLELIEGDLEIRRKGIADTVFAADSAPSERELARSLALRGDLSAPPELGASEALSGRLRACLKAARRRAEFDPGPLTVPAVREVFAERQRFGASSLENYATCPFRYFIQHELRPGELRPAPDPLTRGSLVHAVLERVYDELYIGRRPDAENVEQGVERARSTLAELAVEHGHQPVGARRVAAYRRIEADIVRFIRWDAANPIGERVLMLEAGFGHEGDERGPLDLGGFELHGSIDRIDVLPDGRGLIRDYKNSATVSSRAKIEEQRKLQLQLYTRAMEVLWGLKPAGGIYHPVANQNPSSARPRGILAGPATDLSPTLFPKDGTDNEEEFGELVEQGVEQARLIASQIRAGRVRRDPIGGSCPRWCDLHPICRRERGEKNPEEEPDERRST